MNIYDIKKMKDDLIKEINKYLSNKITDTELREYAWDQFYKWESIDENELPKQTEDDRIYWSAIYDIMHLHNEPEKYDITLKDIQSHYKILIGLIKLDKSNIVWRPTRNQEKSKEFIDWRNSLSNKRKKLP